MWSILWTNVARVAAGVIALKVSACRQHYATAKSSGFPIYYSPVHITDYWWLMFYRILIPFVTLLPASWREPWLSFSQIWSIWKHGHAPFRKAGSDTVILATPKGSILWTCDAAVVDQIFTQHGKTQIPVNMVKFYDFWGPTLGSVEGAEWKKHRRIVTAGFNPSTNSAVWKETVQQTQLLLDHWTSEGSIITVMKDWTSRLALHVLAGVLFQKHLDWKEYSAGTSKPSQGHKMSFEEALFTIISKMGYLFMFPKFLLRNLPIASLQKTALAYDEWTEYIKELRDNAACRVDEIATKKYKTILESIVLAGTEAGTKDGETPLPEESVLGNIFFLLFTGHETTGNTMSFIMLLLAIYPEHQKKIQAELDTHFAGRPMSEWSVEEDYPALQTGMIGAVQKEVLRLYSVVQFIPRLAVSPTTIVDSAGVSHVIPADTLCLLNFPAAFRNEEEWVEKNPGSVYSERLHQSPALNFDPERWLREDAVAKRELVLSSYFPFGIGARSCPGKAFATAEMTAAMATIFSAHSLELVVSDELKVKHGSQGDRAWLAARDQALQLLYDGIETNVNIMLLKELPVRLVKR